jgi:hypothetical protein
MGMGCVGTRDLGRDRLAQSDRGFRALSTERFPGSSQVVRSVKLTVYGPLIGVGFTF